MRKLLIRTVTVAVMTVIAVTAHAEGDAKRFRKFSPPPEQKAKAPPKGAAAAIFPFDGSSPDAPADIDLRQVPNECPDYRDDKAWIEWRDKAIRYLLRTRDPTTEERTKGQQTVPYLHEQDVLMRSSRIVVALERCSAIGRPPPDGPMDPLRTLKRFVRTQHNANYLLPNPQHQFGHGPIQTDDDYLCEARPALELPCLLKSQDFLNNLRHPSTYWKALDLIRKRNAGELQGECKEATPGQPWDTLLYRSRFLTAPDHDDATETQGRFLVVVPGEGPQPDRWIQFGIWTPQDSCFWKKDGCHIHNASVVAVAKVGGPNPPAVTPLLPYDAIADWWRCVDGSCKIARAEDGAILARAACSDPVPAEGDKTVKLHFRLQVNGDTDDCQRCHKVMPQGIHPEKVYRFDSNKRMRAIDKSAVEKAADVVNNRIRDWKSWYGRTPVFSTGKDDTSPAWENYGKWGFGTGPRTWGRGPRTDKWLKECSARAGVKLDAAGRERVSQSMGCARCHNGGDGKKEEPSYGVLNYPQGTDKRRRIAYSDRSPLAPNIVRSHILTGVMPLDRVKDSDQLIPKDGLKSDDERLALFECLSLEYFDPVGPRGLFVDWLKNEGEDNDHPPTTIVEITQPAPSAAQVVALSPALEAPATPASDFTGYCAECHAVNGTATAWGPALRGIAGAQIASTSFRDYSRGLRELSRPLAGQPPPVWDENRLLELLRDPNAFLGKGRHTTAMHAVQDENARRRIVQYLSTLK